MATTVRVETRVHTTLRELAQAERRSISQVIEDAVDRYQKEKFWEGVQEDFAQLQANPAEWAAYRQELSGWVDGDDDILDQEPPYYSPEEEAAIRADVAVTLGG